MRSCFPDKSAGFSLVEVLFALALIGLALGAAATVFRAGLLGDAAAAGTDEALQLAGAKLGEAGADLPLRAGTSEGTEGGYRWRLSIARAADQEAADADLPLYRVEALVQWRDGARQRQIDVATLRLGAPVPP